MLPNMQENQDDAMLIEGKVIVDTIYDTVLYVALVYRNFYRGSK